MKKKIIKQQLSTLIVENKFQEALDIISKYVDGIDNYLESDVLHQTASFNRNHRDFQNDLISREDYNRAISKLIYALTQIIERLPDEGNDFDFTNRGSASNNKSLRKILSLTANPKDSKGLRLDEELRKIKDELKEDHKLGFIPANQ